MRKSEFNVLFRRYVKDNLSPTDKERGMITDIYEAIQGVLGKGNCLQIGSYPRFTAISPVHDLDILYIIGPREDRDPNPSSILSDVMTNLENNFVNPTEYALEIIPQTHSITLQFSSMDEEVFSVDVVPAYIDGKNEFREDKYIVPEILNNTQHKKRSEMYADFARTGTRMSWIPSDPRGYIHITSEIDAANSDFRKAVKFVKDWRCKWKDSNDSFKLKSFHIERIITQYFRVDPNIEIFDAVFFFFCDLPKNLQKAWIPDRANTAVYIDKYVNGLTVAERELMTLARDHFLRELEAFSPDKDVAELLKPGLYKRVAGASGVSTEKFLFDLRIPVLIEDGAPLSISGQVLSREGGVVDFFLDLAGSIEVNRKIDFKVTEHCPGAAYKWKVRNDIRSEDPRGEINDHRTRNNPESTKYKGRHFAECYAIRDGVCVARARQDVTIGIFS